GGDIRCSTGTPHDHLFASARKKDLAGDAGDRLLLVIHDPGVNPNLRRLPAGVCAFTPDCAVKLGADQNRLISLLHREVTRLGFALETHHRPGYRRPAIDKLKLEEGSHLAVLRTAVMLDGKLQQSCL